MTLTAEDEGDAPEASRGAGFIGTMGAAVFGAGVYATVITAQDDAPDWVSWALVLPFALPIGICIGCVVAKQIRALEGALWGLGVTSAIAYILFSYQIVHG